jgi:hypothetical protein
MTETTWKAGMAAGAVYRPVSLIDPAPYGLIDQVTEVTVVPVTFAVNC